MPGNLTALQAQAALDRPLTWLEENWITQTYGWKDYELYCLTFFILVIGYCIGSLPFLTLDFLKIPFFERYRIQQTYRNSYAAVVDCFRSVLGDMFMVILPLNLTSFPFFNVAGINGGVPLPTLPEMALQLATFFVIEDYGNYWLHRWLHTEWAYRKIHWKHHEFTTPMSFAASYAHPLEILILGIPSFVGPAIVRCHVITLWAWIVLRQWEAVETHSGYHFPWSPTRLIPFYGGAEYHDYHHFVGGKSRGNFASVFTWCDYIYGTDKGYRYRKDFELRQAAAKAEARAAAGLGYSVLANGGQHTDDVAKTS